MAKVVCVDALVYFAGTELPERNEATVSWDTDVAEARPFVASISVAFADKLPTWKDWSVSLSGYYDDSDDTIVDAAIAGTTGTIIVYPTRANMTNYWYGTAFLVSIEHTVQSEDYSELNCEAEGSGALTWVNV